MISLDHVSKVYYEKSRNVALDDVSLTIEDGEMVFLLGDSGAGKSTLIRLLLGEETPTSGTVMVDGEDVGAMKRRLLPKYRRRFGVIFQDFRLFRDATVYDNVAFSQRVVVTPAKAIRKRVPRVLEEVGLSRKLKSFPDQLSGGEQQRVAIARALVNGPLYLLADEPTGNLDRRNAEEVMRLLAEVNRGGTTVIVVTHDTSLVSLFGGRVVTLESGKVIRDSGREEGKT